MRNKTHRPPKPLSSSPSKPRHLENPNLPSLPGTKLLPIQKPDIPKKYQPLGFEILHEDRDLIFGSKKAGFLSVAALWEKTNTIHQALKNYVRKGSAKSTKEVYVVHRLDQATSGVMVFAKTESAQQFLKEDWASTAKYYFAIVHGHFDKKSGTLSSYLKEDEEYFVHSTQDSSKGQHALTKYKVIRETAQHSLVKVHLLTGKKNQIRVHMAEAGHPVVGDEKYGKGTGASIEKKPQKHLLLHAHSLELTHPFRHQRIRVVAEVPPYFKALIDGPYE